MQDIKQIIEDPALLRAVVDEMMADLDVRDEVVLNDGVKTACELEKIAVQPFDDSALFDRLRNHLNGLGLKPASAR